MAASLLGLASAFAALGLFFAVGRPASAAGDVMIGIDMTPGASESSVGIATCAAVQPGDAFDADVFISNAQDLVEFELRVDFNPDVISIQSADYGYFLTQSGGQILGPLFDTEKPGRKFLAASEPRNPDSGSGVLARLHLLALNEGTSSLTITSTPTVYGPRLYAAGDVHFADSNGDGIFDGSLTGGTIDVGHACAPSTPLVTPSPAPVTPTPGPGGQIPSPAVHPSGAPPTAPGGGGGGDPTPAPGDHQTTPAPSSFVINAKPSGGSGAANDVTGNGSSSGNDSATDGGSSADQTGPDGGGAPGIASGQSAGTGSGSSSLILIVAAAFAAISVLVGATFLVMQARRRR